MDKRLGKYNLALSQTNSTMRYAHTLWLILLIGCGTATPAPTATQIPTNIPSTATPLPTPIVEVTEVIVEVEVGMKGAEVREADHIAYTHHQADGNRVVAGQGAFPDVPFLDIALDGEPNWLLSAPFGDGVLWVVTLIDGMVNGFVVSHGTVTEIDLMPNQLPAGQPPILVIEKGEPRLLVPWGEVASFSHPVPVGNDLNKLAYIDPDGNLILENDYSTTKMPANALDDGRILVDEQERLLFLSDPTTQYGHGVLGDKVEAKAISLVATKPHLQLITQIPIGDDWVIEGIMPIWADLDQDGQREIIVTRANDNEGAQIVAFSEDGSLFASGPSIGNGFRWRNQMAVGAFDNSGDLHLVDVLTPHIGGTVEFYRLNGDKLDIETGVRQYTSHVIKSRNLDMGISADFNSDGKLEVLVPTQDRTQLIIVGLQNGIATPLWKLPTDAPVMTNLSATQNPSGGLAVGVGLADNRLRIWQSQ